MSKEQPPYAGQPAPVPNFVGGHATWRRERDSMIKVLAEHGVTFEHEVLHSQALPVEDNIAGMVDNFASQLDTYTWQIDTPALQGVSYSFEEMLGDIIDTLKEAAKGKS